MSAKRLKKELSRHGYRTTSEKVTVSMNMVSSTCISSTPGFHVCTPPDFPQTGSLTLLHKLPSLRFKTNLITHLNQLGISVSNAFFLYTANRL